MPGCGIVSRRTQIRSSQGDLLPFPPFLIGRLVRFGCRGIVEIVTWPDLVCALHQARTSQDGDTGSGKLISGADLFFPKMELRLR